MLLPRFMWDQLPSTEAGATGVLKVLNVDTQARKLAPVLILVRLMVEPIVPGLLLNHIQISLAPVQTVQIIIQLAPIP